MTREEYDQAIKGFESTPIEDGDVTFEIWIHRFKMTVDRIPDTKGVVHHYHYNPYDLRNISARRAGFTERLAEGIASFRISAKTPLMLSLTLAG